MGYLLGVSGPEAELMVALIIRRLTSLHDPQAALLEERGLFNRLHLTEGRRPLQR